MTASKKEIARRMEEFQREQALHIAKYGRTCLGVFALADSKDPTNETFIYTIGNTLKKLPELLLIGLCDDGGLLNALSERMIELGRAFYDGEVVDVGAKFSCCVVVASDSVKGAYTCGVRPFFGSSFWVMQVVAPDTTGLFPWQCGCAKPYCDVVVHRAKLLQ